MVSDILRSMEIELVNSQIVGRTVFKDVGRKRYKVLAERDRSFYGISTRDGGFFGFLIPSSEVPDNIRREVFLGGLFPVYVMYQLCESGENMYKAVGDRPLIFKEHPDSDLQKMWLYVRNTNEHRFQNPEFTFGFEIGLNALETENLSFIEYVNRESTEFGKWWRSEKDAIKEKAKVAPFVVNASLQKSLANFGKRSRSQ